MKPLGIQMVWVVVKDFNQSKEFFTTTLGMTLIADSPEYNWAEFSTPEGTHLGMAGYDEQCPIKPGDNGVICITVEDVVATKQELESKDVRCWDIHEVPGHVKMFLIQDASENYYHIVQKLK
jgi:catechol 2,3-dioxygenase-like lactoylglutathione lyase family enzyme